MDMRMSASRHLTPSGAMAQQAAMTNMIDRHLAEAKRARSIGRADEARRHFEAVLSLDPDHAFANNALGLDALNSNDADRAASFFARATAADPGADALWMNLAKARRLLGDDTGERVALEQTLSIDQTHPMALIRLAELHERRGEIALATDRWSAFETLSKSIPDPTPELATVIAHAKAFLTVQRKQLSDALDAALAGPLAAASPSDRRRFNAANDYMLGRRSIFANQCHGYFYPFLPADEYFDREHFPWFAELEAATAVIREEVAAILAADDSGLAPYVTMDRLERAASLARRRADRRGVQARSADRRTGRKTAFGAHSRACAHRLFLDSQGWRAYSAAHRRHQHPDNHPSAADRPRPLRIPGWRGNPCLARR